MNLPRSSVSKLLQDLEAHLGTKLVERTTRAVSVTVEGAAYLERASRLLADLEDMDSAIGSAGLGPRGRLRVDIGSILANQILIPALPDFEAKYPDIELVLGVSDRPTDLIGEGIDCVIRGGALADTALMARKLCELDYVLCASPEYLKGKPVPAVPSDIADHHRVVSYFSAARGRKFPLRFSRGNEHIEFLGQSGIAVNDSSAHLTALLSHLGIGQPFGFMARPHFKTGALVELLPEWKPQNHTLHLVYPASRFPSLKLRVFADWVATVFRPYDQR